MFFIHLIKNKLLRFYLLRSARVIATTSAGSGMRRQLEGAVALNATRSVFSSAVGWLGQRLGISG